MAAGNVCSVLVTGANRGIGLELVKHFLGKATPPKVIFAGCRDPEGARAKELKTLASKHPNVAILQLETTDEESVKAAAKKAEARLGGSGLNVLINNAGVMPPCTLESVTAHDMMDVYNTNLVGAVLVTKAAMNMLTKCEAMSYKDDGILCTAIHPGWVKTDLGSDQADLTVEESVTGIMNVLCNLSEKHHGVLLTWEGKQLPW
ncbi:hypothetical protein lerEdw1_001057 [Lerista edwardsae]|nr:hypothetical protein lerEdw1_001057 [Lerista edwardsae]